MAVSYEDVERVCESVGSGVTVRAIRAELGTGSMGTIARHLSAWRKIREARDHSASVNLLSSQLRNMLSKEISSVLEKAKEDFQRRVEGLEEQNKDLSLEIIRLEEIAAAATKEQSQLQAQLEHWKASGAEQQKANLLLVTELNEEKEKSNAANIKTAEANARFESLEKSLQNQDELRAEIRSLVTKLASAEKDRAVAEARLEETKKSRK